MPSLLVTNDFPPKVGGIQSYLHELWSRLPADETTVLTTAFAGAEEWDATQAFRIVRSPKSVLLPSRALARDVDALAREVGADVVFLDPMLPLGRIAPHVRSAPTVVVAHGAEITFPARLPGLRAAGRRVLDAAAGVIAAGGYPAAQAAAVAGRRVPGVVIPPGVDVDRFRPASAEARRAVRRRFGLDPDRLLVLGLSRLVPRKGFDVVIDAAGRLDLPVQVAIAGRGRDRARLERRARGRADVRFLGPVPEADLAPLHAAADVFAMCCRDRWGGLEAEGFGIVLLEAAASGVPAVAGHSGGSHEAVVDGETGFVVDPHDVGAVADALAELARAPDRRSAMGAAARHRAVDGFAYDRLVADLLPVARGDLSGFRPLP
ncbi:MAG: glycosyltransferase family 4 protein [Actinomycetota bacterium]